MLYWGGFAIFICSMLMVWCEIVAFTVYKQWQWVWCSQWVNMFPGIWGGLLAPRHSPGLPIPLTGLRLWQDPVMGGWPWAVFGCVALPMWASTIVMLMSSLSGILFLLSLFYTGISHWIIELSVENVVLHWARYECTCCTARTLVVEIIIIYCMSSPR